MSHGMTKNGLTAAFSVLIAWAILLVANRYAVTTFHADAWAFSFLQLIFAAVILLTIGRHHKNSTGKMMKHPYTWAISIFRVLDVLFHTSAMVFITATEAELMVQLSMLISVSMAWALLKRRPHLLELPGFFMVGVGLWYLMGSHEGGVHNPVVLLMGVTALLGSLQYLLTELHPESNKALGIRDRCRYTGWVLLLTSAFFMVGSLAISWMVTEQPAWSQGWFPAHAFLDITPRLDSMLALHTIFIAAVTGFLLRAPVMYLDFLSIRLLKSENYTLIMALQPFTILAFEAACGALGWVDVSSVGEFIIVCGLVITLGAFYVVLVRVILGNRLARKQAVPHA